MRKRSIALSALTSLMLIAGLNPAASAHPESRSKPTVVLVHGAWADSSSWDGVVERLLRDGYPVAVFATPLRSLSGDSGALRDYLAAVSGPIVLVGHSYGGAVITNAAAGNASVRALVYVDAFAPAAGQPIAVLAGPDSALTNPAILQFVPAGAPTPTTDLYIDKGLFPAAFANDLPPAKARILAVTQRPLTYGALTEPSGAPAWSAIPSWYEIGTKDKVIPAAAQKQMATAIGAHIRSAPTGHLPMVSRPADVTATIEAADKGTR
jgi:pimeloyl-ACP methyl ester carboxylesterase